MKNTLFVLLLLSIPLLSVGQQKAGKKANTATSGSSAVQAEPENSGNMCRINGEGLRIALSGKDYDTEGITDKNGSCTYQNVPAGDMVITKTGDDKAAPTCKFIITCQGPSKSYTKTGTFQQLSQGVSFRMQQAGTVTFAIK